MGFVLYSYNIHIILCPIELDLPWQFKTLHLGLPWLAQWLKNLPANAGDVGLIPGLGRSHVLQSNEAHVPQLLSLCSWASKTQLQSSHAATTEACMPRAHAQQQKKPLQGEARALQQRPSTAKNKNSLKRRYIQWGRKEGVGRKIFWHFLGRSISPAGHGLSTHGVHPWAEPPRTW